ncbi:MAG: homoserine O-succinyltransferase [Gammaproteobacteria bacterium]|nr:homoserine O-succinyltransferase [Gammaproteobacteria bacterium]
MPLVAHTDLPTFDRLKQEGETILPRDYAQKQEIRELHIGLLNMMPDSALSATERQFFRLIGESNQIAQFYVHPFTLSELQRDEQGQAHVDQFYESFDDIKQQGLDALIITGANVQGPELSEQPFWKPLIEVIDWAYDNVTSTLCSCLATHAVMEFRYQQKRRPLGFKRWGVYSHQVVDRTHPLVAGVNTRFDVPHSRFNQIDRHQFEDAGLKVLVESEQAGVHLAVSEDLFRIVFFQGHPEYDIISLQKEYKREVVNFFNNKRDDYPPLVDNYFNLQVEAILSEYRQHVLQAKRANLAMPPFPEQLISPCLDNTWHDTAEAVINNWIGMVYQLTNIDRRIPFNESVNPADPLGLIK